MSWKQDRAIVYIVWLSVCMLCTALGSVLDASWQPIWTSSGLFGLTASIALAIVATQRREERDAERSRVLQNRIKATMTKLEQRFQSNEAIRDAVRRILDNYYPRDSEQFVIDSAVQDLRHRTSCLIPVALTTRPQSRDASRSVPSAMLRDLSETGVGLVHDQKIDSEHLTAHVKLNDGDQVHLSLALLWEKRWEGHDGWYASGGKILSVVSTESAEREPCLSGNSSDGVGS